MVAPTTSALASCMCGNTGSSAVPSPKNTERGSSGSPRAVRCALPVGHGAKQAAYLDWKVSLLGNIPCARTTNAKGAVFADFTPLPELGELQSAVYFGDGKRHL